MQIEWEEPPTAVLARLGRGRYEEFAAALREHPGRWAVLPGEQRTDKGGKATAQNLRGGKMRGFPKGEFEALSADGKVWVRYMAPAEPQDGVPEPQEAAEPDGEEGDKPSTATVRAWAQRQGITVPDRGRLPQEIFDRYDKAAEAGPRPPRPDLRVASQPE